MEDKEIRLLWRRYKAHTQRPEHWKSLRPGQVKVAGDIVAWSQEPDPRNARPPANGILAREPYGRDTSLDLPTNGYFVRPTGSGKTVSMIDLALGMNCDVKTGALKFDKRVLVLTPTNVLNRQFAAELGVAKYRNPNKQYAYNQAIPEDMVGLYDATANKNVRDEALSKHFVVMTYDSFRKAVEEDRLNVGDFALTLLDEVHTKPRGDVTSEFIREHIFNVDEQGRKKGPAPTLAIGATATHLYKTGNTIGDYLFDGADPIHLTPINQAVKEGEISGYRNVIVETSYGEGATYDGIGEDSEIVRHSRLKQEARDDAAIRILKHGHDSITGQKYKDKKSVWYCRDIDHANRLAAKINAAMGMSLESQIDKLVETIFADKIPADQQQTALKSINSALGINGKNAITQQDTKDKSELKKRLTVEISTKYEKRTDPLASFLEVVQKLDGLQTDNPLKTYTNQVYAKAVSGETNGKEFSKVIFDFNQNQFKALTNADILIQGFDDQEAELCFMVHPTQSPTEVLQMGGRVLRKHPKKHHATIFTFLDPDLENQPTFGELAGGYQSIGGEEEFGPTAGEIKGEPLVEQPWPEEIRDLNAHYLTHDIQLFAEKRRAAQSAGRKPKGMWTAEEMAQALGVKAEFIKRFVYEPLRGLFDQRHSRQQEIKLDTATASAAANDHIFVNGQRFAVGTEKYPGMGYWGTSANDTSFCLSEEAKNACRFALYGKLPEPKKYLYNQITAARVLGVDEKQLRIMSEAITEAYHTRDAYKRSLPVTYTKDGEEHQASFTLTDDVMFCLDRGIPKLFFTADGLCKLYQLEHGTTAEVAAQWSQRHQDKISQVKTPRWLNKDEAVHQLGLHRQHQDYKAFDKVWNGLERASRSTREASPNADGIQASMKRDDVAPSVRPQLCVSVDSLQSIQNLMQEHGAAGFVGAAAAGRRSSARR